MIYEFHWISMERSEGSIQILMKGLLGLTVRPSELGRMILSYFPVLTGPGGHPERLQSCNILGRRRAALGTLGNCWDPQRDTHLGQAGLPLWHLQ